MNSLLGVFMTLLPFVFLLLGSSTWFESDGFTDKDAMFMLALITSITNLNRIIVVEEVRRGRQRDQVQR